MIRRFISPTWRRHISNIPGRNFSKKFVVIESDDWGNIRMPSEKTFDSLIKSGIDLMDDGLRFNKYDALATGDDLSLLFELLSSVKDSTGRPVVITPVAVVANPDFKKIKADDFQTYYYEPFTETLKRNPGCDNSYSLWKEGIEKRLFVPQFHGREHLNVQPWLRALQNGNKRTRIAFDHGIWGISTANDPDIKLEFQAAFDFIDPSDIKYQKEVIKTGLDLFEELLGYRASFFVPPNGPFSKELEVVCVKSGIKYLSTSKFQQEPIGQGEYKKRFHWLGQKNGYGLTYITRNCFFEPSDEGKDWIDSCLEEVSSAFKWRKPAVISSHRVNFIGALHKNNRDRGLEQLESLLKKIVKKWPDVQFITSEELGKIVAKKA